MKFNIITLGCKVNAYESNFINESLVNNGFSFCEDPKESDIIIINTCSVTDTSDKKSLKTVRRAKRENPEAIIVVCGCSSQNNPDMYKDINPNVLLGTKQKSKIATLLKNYLENRENYVCVTEKRDTDFENMEITKFNQARAYIKIQDGCNNFCSYCIIPFVRGDLRFKKFADVINEANNLVDTGIKEIVLTGIHTGSYNIDGKDLTDLIWELSKIEDLKRIRLSSVEITELDDKFLDMVKRNEKFCSHVHVPLQSGCDEILKVMNRKYDTEYYRNKIKTIRSIRPDISITTDVIVGHNYETEELFNKTYEFCKEMEFSKIHVFPYSKRTGTAASRMPEEVSEADKKQRAHKLLELSNKLENKYFSKFIGKEVDVLVETVKDKISTGHTSNYLKVELNEELEVNNIYKRVIK